MKRFLEVVLAAAVLALGAFVAVRLVKRRAGPDGGTPAAAMRPGTDVENPDAPAPAPAARGVTRLPMVRQTLPSRRRDVDVPPPPPPR
ncbi:MAG: hypothetical protein KGM24_11160 [Elusimicrobia bacterium]|nr:hypothetical protein [Elusimicrobiota bacterium]